MCVFPLHIGPDSWKIPDIAFLWVSFHNPPGNWPVRATTCWINHFYFAFQNNVGLSVQQNNNYGTPPFANPSNMDKVCGFTEETSYFFNTKLVTSYHYVFKTSSLQTLKKKISRKSFSETIFQSFPFDNLNFCNSMQRCQESPRCGEDFLFMKKGWRQTRGNKTKNMGSDSLILLYCLSSLVAMTVVMVVSHPWKKAVWGSLGVFCPLITSFSKMKTIPDCPMGGGQMGGWVGVTGCLNSVRDNCTIGTGRPPLFIWGNCPLKHISTIDLCYAQNWTRKTTTHARFL